jgi:hypothetical protein
VPKIIGSWRVSCQVCLGDLLLKQCSRSLGWTFGIVNKNEKFFILVETEWIIKRRQRAEGVVRMSCLFGRFGLNERAGAEAGRNADFTNFVKERAVTDI